METWEQNILEAIEIVDTQLEEIGEPFQPVHKWGLSSEVGEVIGLNLRKRILEDAILIGRNGMPTEDSAPACVSIDCKSYGLPHLTDDPECHIFGE